MLYLSTRIVNMEPKAHDLDGDDVESWAELCDELVEVCDNELPDAAAEFGESVSEKLSGIAETIRRTDRITDGQRSAIANMESGIDRWINK